MTLPLDAIDDSGPSSTATALGEPDQGPELERFLAARGTDARERIRSTLAWLDVLRFAKVCGVRIECLAIAFELQAAEPDIAEDLRRARER